MKSRLIRIGNSRGLRLPKPIIDQVGLDIDVEMEVRSDGLMIRPSHRPREGWSAAAAEMVRNGEGGLLDGATPTRFDEEEWTW